MSQYALAGIGAAAIISLVALMFLPDPIDLEARQYCEMVGIYHASDGEYGWPDFKHIYDEECTK